MIEIILVATAMALLSLCGFALGYRAGQRDLKQEYDEFTGGGV